MCFLRWDGTASEGLGGTADVVGYAKSFGRVIIHINPVTAEDILDIGKYNVLFLIKRQSLTRAFVLCESVNVAQRVLA